MKQKWSKIALSLGFIASSVGFNVAHAESLIAINTLNQISLFDSSNAGAATFTGITGLGAGESLIGIDLRPSNNTVYGITSANKIYTIDTSAGSFGTASFVAALSSNVINSDSTYGFDFNPVADRTTAASLRVVSSAGDNYAINASTGAVTVATSIAAGNTAVAYSNSDPSQTGAPASTQLYYVNSKDDTLSVANSAFNAPTINKIGDLTLNGKPLDIFNANGFELFANGNAFLAATVGSNDQFTKLLGINLGTGAATDFGTFSLNTNGTTFGIRGLAAAPSAVPVPAAAWLFGSALVGFAGFRRKSV